MAYDTLIEKASNAYGIDPYLIRAQMQQESGGNNRAVSNKGAGGLMQLMPATAKELGVTDRFDPEQNIMAGAKYLRKQLDKYGSPELALAAYNAGPGAVDKYGGIPPYKETRNYVKRIMGNYARMAQDGLTGLGNAIIKPARADETPEPSPEMMDKFMAWKTAKSQPNVAPPDNGSAASAPPEMMEKFKAWKAEKDKKSYDPTVGMSTTDKVLAGVGGAMMDVAQGAGQMVGLVSPDDVAEKRRLDAPLLDTTSGKVGNFIGNAAVVTPTLMLPGAATLKGATAIGAGLGALQPAASEKEVLGNAALGAGASAAGVALPRVAEAAYKGGKALLVDPFTQNGMQEIAGRTLARFSENPNALANAIEQKTLTGAKPTLAEITGDKGIAGLQDALMTADPQLNNIIAQRLQDNNAARVEALKSLAGDAAKREAATSARESAAEPLYQQAFAKKVELTDKLKELLDRPSVKKAFPRAAQLAKEEGREFGFNKPKEASKFLLDAKGNKLKGIDDEVGQITGQTLHDIKMGMDALLKDPNSGIAGAEINAVKSTRDALLKEIESAIPEYGQARQAYAQGSAPINAMDIGEHLSKKALSNTSDLAGNQRLQANALLGILKDPKKMIEQGTGRKGLGNDLSKIFTPVQMEILRDVAKEVDKAAAVQSAGAGAGSATAKRLASQNVLRQLLGPLGLPERFIDSALAQTFAKPLGMAYGGIVEPKIQRELANAVLNPWQAKKVLGAAQRASLKKNMVSDNAIKRVIQGAGTAAALESMK